MNRRVTIVAMTVGLLASVPTAAWADQKPGSSVVSSQNFKLAGFFGRGDFERHDNGNHWGRNNGNQWGRGHDNGNHWGRDHDHGHHGGDKSHGC